MINDAGKLIVHVPVMLSEVLEYLNLRAGGTYVDCTLGMGGHTQAILEQIGENGRVIAVDRDEQSLALAKKNLGDQSNRCHFMKSDFRDLDEILKTLGISKVDGILLDLGISSFQLDNPERGFGIKTDGPLDMRMDQEGSISAYDVVNSMLEKDISQILHDYGDERWHRRIARSIVYHREMAPIKTTQELSHAILKAIPHRSRGHQRDRIHPATRSFQAIRIYVNRELESLEVALSKSFDLLKSTGRIVVISFHSLEDRITKLKFREFSKSGVLKLLTKKPLRPRDEEIVNNPRARSACLRAAERI